jgi:hypothetical protein
MADQQEQSNSSGDKTQQVSFQDLSKLLRAIDVLRQSNLKLNRVIRQLSNYYERKHSAALDLKDKQIAHLQSLLMMNHVFVVRVENCFCFLTNYSDLNKALSEQARVLFVQICENVNKQLDLCVSMAQCKYKDNVIVKDFKIIFFSNADATRFEEDIKTMFNHTL